LALCLPILDLLPFLSFSVTHGGHGM
jgi:hypothetical protein